MIFTELRFLLLFAAAWICFAAAPHAWRAWVLTVWGLIFYAVYAQAFVLVALALTLVVALATRRVWALSAGALVVGLLAYFKLRAVEFLPAGGPGSNVLIPLGLSYLSFELLHVLIERRRGRLTGVTVPGLLAYVFFVPARIAGPIKRYPEFMAAVQNAVVSTEGVYAGGLRILLGLAKKLLVADILRLTVVSEIGYVSNSRQAWTIVLAYTLQIFLDFSAYTDIAIGFARTLGIVLPENFQRPYLATNIREFWDRWHITLSHWVRDYIFLPAGRRLFQTPLRSLPALIAATSYLVTFLVVGLWHGITPGFVIWGLYHAALLSAYHVVRTYLPRTVALHPLYSSQAVRLSSIAVTFLLVAVGWVPFMTADLTTASKIIRLMLGSVS